MHADLFAHHYDRIEISAASDAPPVFIWLTAWKQGVRVADLTIELNEVGKQQLRRIVRQWDRDDEAAEWETRRQASFRGEVCAVCGKEMAHDASWVFHPDGKAHLDCHHDAGSTVVPTFEDIPIAKPSELTRRPKVWKPDDAGLSPLADCPDCRARAGEWHSSYCGALD